MTKLQTNTFVVVTDGSTFSSKSCKTARFTGCAFKIEDLRFLRVTGTFSDPGSLRSMSVNCQNDLHNILLIDTTKSLDSSIILI